MDKLGKKTAIWKCEQCGWTGEKPVILPVYCSAGIIVDVEDYFCPEGCDDYPVFQGNKGKKEKWWEEWMDSIQPARNGNNNDEYWDELFAKAVGNQ